MQIMIDIPEDVYKRTVFYREFRDLSDCVATIKALEKAISLPKGHGDIYDYNDLSKLVGEDFRFFLSRLDLNLPQPIIKADKEVQE